ncbi:MAG: PAS domain-containing protein, partial [Candidatus Sumerlaeota bacterium]|nr:PAS domain-containing protein [Candidatus Sumerlaeota bacterium]
MARKSNVSKSIPATAKERQDKEMGERFYRMLIEAIRDYAIVILSPEGRVLTWNGGAEAVKGYRPEEIIGKHFS